MKYVGLLDCNNFFVSCERLFRPDLEGKPVAVLSSNDGCIVARSKEVKELGVPMGTPVFKVRDVLKENNVTLFSSNFTLYRDISDRVMKVLEEKVGHIQIYSIDEAFFEISDKKNLEKYCRDIKEHVERCVGMPVTIGVGATKTIAKCASEIGKKENGVKILINSDWLEVQEKTHIGTIWGVGRETSLKCIKLGITNVRNFLDTDPAQIRQSFGVGGARLQTELSGVTVHGIESMREQKQNIMSSRSFQSDVTNKDVLFDALIYHVSHIAEEIREMKVCATTLHISIRPSRHGNFAFKGGGMDVHLEFPTNDTRVLIREVKALLNKLYEHGIPYKKAGITLGGFISVDARTGSLFEKDNSDMSQDKVGIMHVIDGINKRFGGDTVSIGRVHKNKMPWHSRNNMCSPKYTTNWSELRLVLSG